MSRDFFLVLFKMMFHFKKELAQVYNSVCGRHSRNRYIHIKIEKEKERKKQGP